MGRLFLVLIWILPFSSLSWAGEWSIMDTHTLRFEGSIKTDDIARFDKLFTQDIETIIVTSGGGDVLAAIPIAEKIQRQQVDIVVEGICASSCANYFFIAADKKKVAQESLLLFHGGITPMLLENKEQMVEEMTNVGVDPEQIESYLKGWQDGAEKERALYKNAGVDMALLEYSHRVTNGGYDFWAPPLPTLTKLGVKNIAEFWYPASDEAMNVLVNKISQKYSKNTSSNSTRMHIVSGDIEQQRTE